MKTLKIVIVGLLVGLGLVADAQTTYHVKAIPDSLLKNANAVKRVDINYLRLTGKGKATHKQKVAYTILNEKAAHLAVRQESYNRFFDIKSIHGTLFDAAGEEVKSLKQRDISDLSGMGGGTEVTESRAKEFGFYYKNYPYTVEFEIETGIDGLMFLPNWMAVDYQKMGVQQSSMEVEYAAGLEVLHKSFNYKGAPVVEKRGDMQVLRWSVNNVPAMLSEPFAPQWYELAPAVFMSMKEFEMEGYEGSNASWESFGSFIYQLKQGKDKLPDPLKEKVHSLVDGLPTTFEKVAVLYKYMQDNTRYISIQLGIGGWQPFDASYVYNKKYGDCKALTNYMGAMLAEAGIPAIYTLVKSGAASTRFIEDFPSSQFDHVILCVPNGKDSIWLECTSQTLPAGYLSRFTQNRKVLLVKEKGSTLVRTPAYGLEDNLQVRHITAAILPEGHLKGESKTVFTGLQQDEVHDMIHHLPKDKQKEYLQEQFSFGTYDILSFGYNEKAGFVPQIAETLEIEAQHYAQVTGRRLILNPNILTRQNWRISKDSTRLFDAVFHIPYIDIDTVSIEVGPQYAAESMPAPIQLQSKFGSYTTSVVLKDGKLLYCRKLAFHAGRIPAAQWNDLVAFVDEVSKADRRKVVLAKPAS